ncbi:MAG: GntR family transcriptional regulator [Rhizobiales bacterium 65-79]|nr:MAG: GntR family transcriptional regulator [Rhizobiales bacterium 65-79]
MSRGQWVYEKLIQDVRDGKYAGGVRIREEEIARALGVSRTPVREALSRLQARGLLELAPFGLVVTELSRQQVLELYAVREILEGSAARFAAQHASDSEISALHSIAREFDRDHADPQRLAHLNRQLHGSIYEAAHNRYLMRSLNEFQDTLALLASTTFTVVGRPKEASKEHAVIIKAIERRDADAAEQAARQHIHRAQEARLKMMLGIVM